MRRERCGSSVCIQRKSARAWMRCGQPRFAVGSCDASRLRSGRQDGVCARETSGSGASSSSCLGVPLWGETSSSSLVNEVDESAVCENCGDDERELRADDVEDDEVLETCERRGGRGAGVGGEVRSAPPYSDQSTWTVEFMARRAPSVSEESIAKEMQRRPAAPRDLVWQMGPRSRFEGRGCS